MKKIISILVVLSIVFTLCSCTPKEIAFEESVPEPTVEATLKPTSEPTPEPSPETSPEPTSIQEPVYEIVGEQEESIKIDFEKIMKEESINDEMQPLNPPNYKTEELLFNNWRCFTVGLDAGWYNYLNNTRPDLAELLLYHFPEVVWREKENGDIYALLDGDDGTRVYIIYSKATNFKFPIGCPLIMKEKLSYEDFAEIKISDSWETVKQVDVVTQFYMRNFDTCNDETLNSLIEAGNPPCSVHLLTDGILKYTYERSGEEGNYVYTIVDIEYHENFKMEGLGGVTDYSIAEVDYVD